MVMICSGASPSFLFVEAVIISLILMKLSEFFSECLNSLSFDCYSSE
jgi:hypothetical protein